KRLVWTSKATDPTQIWMCDFDSGNGALVGKPHQATDISTDADGGIWSPDGKNIVFVSAVYPDCKDDACNKRRDEELKKSKVKAKIFSHLFYRHWTAFTEFKRSHLFVQSAEAPVSGAAAGTAASTPRDLTPGDHDVPPFSLGGQDMYAISPDGQEVAYTSNGDEVEATSTNNEIFVVPMAGGTPKKISTSPGNDNTPQYSPDDGTRIAWRSQARGGFEADKQNLLVYSRRTGETRNATAHWDRSVGSFVWRPDGAAFYLTAEDHGQSPIWELVLFDEQPMEYARGLHADDLAVINYTGNEQLFFTRQSIQAPNEIAYFDNTADP